MDRFCGRSRLVCAHAIVLHPIVGQFQSHVLVAGADCLAGGDEDFAVDVADSGGVVCDFSTGDLALYDGGGGVGYVSVYREWRESRVGDWEGVFSVMREVGRGVVTGVMLGCFFLEVDGNCG